eukprot:13446150-Alexandrium_andersonii.AAC.1
MASDSKPFSCSSIAIWLMNLRRHIQVKERFSRCSALALWSARASCFLSIANFLRLSASRSLSES